jgi:hypothetical protein
MKTGIRADLGTLVNFRAPKTYLPAIAKAAAAEDMSMSAWIRRALKSELLASGYGRILATGQQGAAREAAGENAPNSHQTFPIAIIGARGSVSPRASIWLGVSCRQEWPWCRCY